MNLKESCILKEKIKLNTPRLVAVNNLRDFKNSGKWRVDANDPITGDSLRFRSEEDYAKYISILRKDND